MVARSKTAPDSVTIPSEEMSFHPHSFADDAGRLFRWNGTLCRGITHAQAPFFGRLFREGVVQALVEQRLLIESEPTDRVLNGYAAVVRHRKIPFVSYPNEWCAAMLRDAALKIVDLMIELTQRGLSLRDAHPWNVLFDSSTPVWVDLASIAPQENEGTWSAYDEFCRFCYYPLILMAHGQERIARTLMPEYEGVLRSEVLTLVRGSGPSRFIFSRILRRTARSIQSIFRKRSGQPTLTLLYQVRRDLEEIQLPSYEGRHRRRRNESMPSPSSATGRMSRPLILRRLLTKLRPDSVLDLSRGPIWTTTVPAIMGFKVVSVDSDAARVSAIYDTAREKDLPILPLIVDFIKPTPSVGFSDHYSIAATERLKCDLVLALGLTRRIALENHLPFDLIAEGLASFSRRWLIVEFEERESSQANRPGRLEDFVSALSTHFCDVSIVSHGEDNEVLLLCEK